MQHRQQSCVLLIPILILSTASAILIVLCCPTKCSLIRGVNEHERPGRSTLGWPAPATASSPAPSPSATPTKAADVLTRHSIDSPFLLDWMPLQVPLCDCGAIKAAVACPASPSAFPLPLPFYSHIAQVIVINTQRELIECLERASRVASTFLIRLTESRATRGRRG